MGAARLTIDLDSIAANWERLAERSGGATGVTIKAEAYGLGAAPVARRLARAGVRHFFVAFAEEAATVRQTVGTSGEIFLYSGHMEGDAQTIRNLDLIPLINSAEQLARHLEALAGHPFGIQLDTGMNRLGMKPAEWAAVRDMALQARPQLIISHLACADEPDHAMNSAQLRAFRDMTDGCSVPRSLAATGGILLGQDYHFDLTRPGIGLYGGAPFAEAYPVLQLELPVIQVRELAAGEAVGYNRMWTAPAPARIATVAGGYADGILRQLSNSLTLWADDVPCPVVGRVSMDLLTVDVTHLTGVPEVLHLLGAYQGIEDLAAAAGTIGYEILTALGARYRRRYLGQKP
jgi:alanine racemase